MEEIEQKPQKIRVEENEVKIKQNSMAATNREIIQYKFDGKVNYSKNAVNIAGEKLYLNKMKKLKEDLEYARNNKLPINDLQDQISDLKQKISLITIPFSNQNTWYENKIPEKYFEINISEKKLKTRYLHGVNQ